MNIGEKLHGFEVTDKKFVSELSADVYIMRHEASGARLVYIAREDDNKTFSISFRTLPEDSSGVFHIIEHSVLCGSEKYPLKDPFVELLKGSLNTFLNAMTFQDKTMYPVASRNNKDFLNLVSIYMDAVLHPLVLKNPNAFYQEGWHYELGEDGTLSYKGVVLNEMRGDYSSPEAIEDRHLNAMLYAGTPYAEDSGGDPEFITTLTYEKFLSAHKKYYNPAFAELFLDGSVDLGAVLSLLDSYLGEYSFADRDAVIPQIPDSKCTAPVSRKVEYEVKDTESLEDKNRVCRAYLISRYDEPLTTAAAGIITSALFGTNESAAKKKIIDSGLCEDVVCTVRDGIKEHSAIFEFINVKDGREDELISLFEETLAEIADGGIGQSELLATVNSTEFRTREKDFGSLPLGVAHAIVSLESLLYSDDATQNLEYDATLAALRDGIETGFYEGLIRTLFLENERRATLYMRPSRELTAKRQKKEREALELHLEKIGDAGVKEIKEMNERLAAWQNEEESDEALLTIPTLTLADISPKPRRTPIEVESHDGVEIITHDIETRGIIYTDLFFDITDISRADMSLLSFLTLLVGNLGTDKYSAIEVQRLVKTHLGNFDTKMTPITKKDGAPRFFFHISASSLASEQEMLCELSAHILLATDFSDRAAIKSLLRQSIIAAEDGFASGGHQVALGRVNAMQSVECAAREYYSGYESYAYLKELEADFDEKFDELSARLKSILSRFVCRSRLCLSITGEHSRELEEKIIAAFEKGERVAPVCNILPLERRKEGILIPARVAFAAAGGNVFKNGYELSGSFDVVRTLVGYEFLWGKIRVLGGAYGAGMLAGLAGNISFYSYRDPTPKKSVECFGEVSAFLREFAKEGREVTKYIIGAIGDCEPMRTPRVKGLVSSTRYLRGLTFEDSKKMRASILSTDSAELLRIADMIDKISVGDAVCIVAGAEKLDSIKDELDFIITV